MPTPNDLPPHYLVIDLSTGVRPAVLGGECSSCLHVPPAHEPTCEVVRKALAASVVVRTPETLKGRVIAFFAEDDFDSVHTTESLAAAHAFCEGVTAGANAYGAGKVRTYVLPDDEAQMVTDEHVGEVIRALDEMKNALADDLKALAAPPPEEG